MSKADILGAGASFGQARGGISARRAAINSTAAAPTEGAPPPVELPVTEISLNPDNPRSELGDLTDLGASLRDHGQKTAISIMGRFAWLEGNPGREVDLEPDTKFVVIDGNSRLAAAREAGLTTIKVMVADDLGSNPDELLESALVANIHRQDLDHLDEAKALEQLLKVHGTQEALAARLHRSQGWISQRLALLTLTPELKEKLETGQEPASLLRRVGKKKPEDQQAHLEELKAKQGRSAAAKRKATGQPAPSAGAESSDYYAVMEPAVAETPARLPEPRDQGQAPRPTPWVYSGDPTKPLASGVERPEAKAAGPGKPAVAEQPARVQQLPTHDWEQLADIVIAELPEEALHSLTEKLLEAVGADASSEQSA
ncbi:ParB/RepB/Spo0J family partition protein [Streptomyces sp. NPDC018055]|uniref:ParB/RepB/Spo0J family partition protein n=1 Tax=Streptomyces sp. NPDC018055 TaxID=3365038 RepID=UPI0037B65873